MGRVPTQRCPISQRTTRKIGAAHLRFFRPYNSTSWDGFVLGFTGTSGTESHTQKGPRARDTGPIGAVVLPWGATTDTPKSPKQGDSGAHKQKPRPHMPKGPGGSFLAHF